LDFDQVESPTKAVASLPAARVAAMPSVEAHPSERGETQAPLAIPSDADQLVMLDGSSEHDLPQEIPSLPNPQKLAPAFGPPAEDDLELDGQKEAKGPKKPWGNKIEERSPSFRGDQRKAPLAAPPQSPRSTSAASPPSNIHNELSAGESFELAAKAQEAPSSPPPPRVPSAMKPVGTHGSAIRRHNRPVSWDSWESIGVFFGDRPRARILIGFILALSLGSILPSCFARSVMQSRVQPLLVDLSSVKVHGAVFAALGTANEIEERIANLQSRFRVYTMVMWLGIGGLIGIGWFYLTREY
jgi:hypothetical protein